MGVKKKHVPGCGCCGGCVYSASNGCEYSDGFDSLDAGWLAFQASVSVASSRLEVLGNGPLGSLGLTYRSFSPTGNDYFLIAEVTLPEISVFYQGLVIDSNTSYSHMFQLAQDDTPYNIFAFGNDRGSHGPTPAAGDKLTISLTGTGGGTFEACFFVNGVLIYEESASLTITDLILYGLVTAFGGTSKYDTFTIQTSDCS